MAQTFARDVPDGCTLTIRLHPGSRKNAVTGVHAEAVKIALTAPPVDGKANEALIAFLAETLHLPRARINIVAGLTSRSKTLRITGKSAAEVAAALFPTEIAYPLLHRQLRIRSNRDGLSLRRRHLQIRSRHIRIGDLQTLGRLDIDVRQHDILHR